MSLTKPNVFSYQPKKFLTEDNPEDAVLYTVLEKTRNVRIKSIFVKCIWSAQPLWLQVVVFLKKTTITYNVDSPDSNIPYFACNTGDEAIEELLETTDESKSRAFLIEDQSVKVAVRCSGGTVSNISAIVKWSQKK